MLSESLFYRDSWGDQIVSIVDFGSSFHYCVIKTVTADVLLPNKMKCKGFAKPAGGKS